MSLSPKTVGGLLLSPLITKLLENKASIPAKIIFSKQNHKF
jgi:hypothetical protein